MIVGMRTLIKKTRFLEIIANPSPRLKDSTSKKNLINFSLSIINCLAIYKVANLMQKLINNFDYDIFKN